MASGKTLQSTIEIAGVLSPSLQAAINNAVSELEKMSQETLDQVGAAEKLSAEISAQESVLNSLRKGYADYVVSGRESSEEAETLSDKIEELSKELDENQDTLAAAEKAAKRLGKQQDDTADAFTMLERTISGQEDDLEALRREYANVALEQGKSSKEAKQLGQKISSLSGDLSRNRQKLNAAEQAADQFADALDDAGQSAKDSGEGYTVLKDALGDLVADGISVAMEAIKELAFEGDSALSKLEARTGAAGSKMEGFEDVMYEVYNANYGESLGDVSEALSTVIQMTDDLDNASLAQITKNAIALEDIFGFDVTESMRTANMLMDKFGITSDEAFNLIVQGAQNGLNKNDDLLDTINEYSVHFEQMGFDADAMFNSLVNGTETGAFSVDKLGDAVKEFSIRAMDDSDSTAEAFKDLGLNVEVMEDKFAAGGETAAEAFRETVKRLGEVDNAVWQNQIGVALFGTMYEDLGIETITALGNMEGAIKSTNDAMAQADTAAYDNLESSISQLGRTLKAELLQPIVEKVTPVLKTAVDYVNAHVGPTIDWLIEKMPGLGAVVAGVGAAFAAVKVFKFVKGISSLFGVMKNGFSALGGGVSGGAKGGGLADMKNTAKVMGSIGIAVGSIAAIIAAFGALRKIDGYDELMADGGAALGQLCDIIADIGLVGAAFTAFVAVAGKTTTVKQAATGIADIAIAMLGMEAIVAAFGALAQIDGFNDLMADGGETMGQLCDIIADISLVGGAFVAAAGLIGAIPVAVLTGGMANIALALAGIEAVVLAFGALAQIDGIDKFMTDGGTMLTTICGIIGNVAGSLIGGIGEGVTASLPTMGANLSAFATSIEPMFDTFAGVDTAGLSDFAGALAALIAVLAGEKIVGMITGGIDYEGLGTNLSSMATGMSGFFSSIMEIPEGGFDKATALFDCLAGISSLPKEGGVVGWFQGEVDYAKMSAGLNQLAGTTTFFSAIQGIPDEAFPKATALFDCLAGIKALPKDGGVVGWFAGEVDFTKISTGVQQLGSEGLIGAITAISAIPENGFTSLTAMFNTLAGIKAVPKEGGVFGWFSGSSTEGLTSVAGELPGVATNIAAFFTNLGGRTDFTPITALFDTLSNIEIDSDVAEKGFWSGVSQLGGMGTELSKFAANGATFFTTVNGMNLANLTGFWDALAGASGLPAALATLDASVGTALSNMLTTTQTKMGEIRDEINLDTSEEKVSGSMSSISTTMNDKLSGAFSTASDKFQGIYTTIKDKMDAAKDAVADALSAIKDKFSSASWSLPKIKLPHLKVSGDWSFNPPKVPKFSVSWYKDGGILTQPTVFGAAGNTLLAGGEAGAEAVLPLKVLWDKMETLIRSVINAETSTGDPSEVGLTATAGRLLSLDDFSLGSLADSGGVVFYYDFSDFTWSPQIQIDGNGNDEDDFMAKLRAHEAEFFDWLEEFIKMREVAQYA